jgi:N-methylhydantoinase A
VGETAWGVRHLALEGMVKAVRTLLHARGTPDPRRHALVSYGGCGSLFTPEIARAIGAPRVYVPELASVFSAFGASTADIRRERVHALGVTLPVDPAVVDALTEKLRAEVLADLEADGVAAADRSVHFEADLRFRRQISELSTPIPPGPVTAASLEAAATAFREEYARRYGQGAIVLGAPLELVTVRAVGTGRTVQGSFETAARSGVAEGTPVPASGSRAVQLGRDAARTAVATHSVADLVPGHLIAGPALVDGSDTTIWIPPGATARVDARSTLVVEVRP